MSAGAVRKLYDWSGISEIDKWISDIANSVAYPMY